MTRSRFWASALATAAVVAALLAWLFPYGPLGIEDEVERQRAWLLTLWTAGMLAICFGAAGLLNAFSGVGFRDVSEAGSLEAAVQARRETIEQSRSGFYNFAGWTVSTGAALVLIYFAAWLSLGS